MRTYAIKTRVDNGPGTIGVEISLARALHVRTDSVTTCDP